MKDVIEIAKTSIKNGMKKNEAINKLEFIAFNRGLKISRKKLKEELEK